MPDEEEAELASASTARKGFTPEGRGEIASPTACSRTPSTHSTRWLREELGLDPDELGNPVERRLRLLRCVRGPGAVVPVISRSCSVRRPRQWWWRASPLALLAMFGVGGAAQPAHREELPARRAAAVAVGFGAAAVTYLVGRVIGVSVAG